MCETQLYGDWVYVDGSGTYTGWAVHDGTAWKNPMNDAAKGLVGS